MATLVLARSPGQKLKTGDKVLCGVDVVDTTPIANRVAAFRKVHEDYSAAEKAVRAAVQALQDHREIIAASRVDLNVAIEMLAIVLPLDGFERRQPFRAFGAPNPSVLCIMAFADAATQVLALERTISRHAGVSAKTTHAAETAGQAARKLLGLVQPNAELEKARYEAMAKRDAFAPVWERAFANLKRAAKAIEDDGFVGIFDALFDRPAPKKKSSGQRRGKPSAKLDVAPVSVPASQ